MRPGRTTRGRWTLAATALALALMASAGLGSAAPIVPDPEEPGERMALRLHDLPPGYLIFGLGSEGANDSFLCEDIVPSDAGRQLARWVDRFHPHGCIDGYYRTYRVPGLGPTPPLVGTGALDTGSVAAAESGLALSPLLLAKLVEDAGELSEAAPAAVIGDGTRLFHWRGVPGFLEGGRLGTYVAWRSGTALGAVLVTGRSLARTDSTALELARRQQVHIAAPTPYTEAERDTVEVSLDNPESNFPVRWLGRIFKPGHGLPVTELFKAAGPPPTDYRPDVHAPRVRLRYTEGPNLTLWPLPAWKRFKRSEFGRRMQRHASRCTTSEPLQLARGHAVVFASRFTPFLGCRRGGRLLYSAHAFVGGTVVAVNQLDCAGCSFPNAGPYNSLKGVKAVLRGLELRPKPDYSAAP